MSTLRRSVPFLAHAKALDEQRALLLDHVEVSLSAADNPEFARTVSRPISLGSADHALPADQVEQIVEAQYQAALEFIFGHPVWQTFRDGEGQAALHSYLLESRHYLAAAPLRMASGITDSLRPSRLIELQAEHVVEEAEHDTFFENALSALGCSRDLVREARPSPVTVEWIHLMRTVAAYSPLAAGICSGLLEYTAGDTNAVTGWHHLLVEKNLLSRKAMEAIFEHVETDLGLGHGSNWRKAVQAARIVPAEQLADWLNAVTLVAEMIYRWLDTFEAGLAGEVVAAMPRLKLTVDGRTLGGEIDGLPVWPAEVYQSVVHGPRSDKARTALAVSYAFGGKAADIGSAGPGSAARDFVAGVARDHGTGRTADELLKIVDSWFTAIDGHELWTELTERPTYPLVYGWMVENYHYVAGIWQHTGAAVSTCPDPAVRSELVRHLTEEFEHGAMFRKGIEHARGDRYGGLDLARMRPLPTTVTFIGTLRELALRDWKAYVLALTFLQRTLRTSENGTHERHDGFYRRLLAGLPEAESLIEPMRRHDQVDAELGHSDDVEALIRLMAHYHEITTESIAAAAIVPQLAWSFLDGVQRHYAHGDGAVLQRIGWHADA